VALGLGVLIHLLALGEPAPLLVPVLGAGEGGGMSPFWDIHHIRILAFLKNLSNKDITFIFKNLDILVRYQIFTIFNLNQISLFSDICYLFIVGY